MATLLGFGAWVNGNTNATEVIEELRGNGIKYGNFLAIDAPGKLWESSNDILHHGMYKTSCLSLSIG